MNVQDNRVMQSYNLKLTLSKGLNYEGYDINHRGTKTPIILWCLRASVVNFLLTGQTAVGYKLAAPDAQK